MLSGGIHSSSALNGSDIGPHGDKQAAPDRSSMAAIAEVPATFEEAMSRFPSGVVIATASDEQGKLWGFTASSFSSVSREPPLVLVCLSKGADCHGVFSSRSWFAINVLSAADEAAAVTFARRGADKFAALSFHIDEHGSPVLQSAITTLTCQKFAIYDCGDHSVIVGLVTSVKLGSQDNPMIYAARRFGRFLPGTMARPSMDQPVRYCFRCGSAVVIGIPQGDTLSRPICHQCGNIHYINPTMIVGCIAEAADGRIVLCRRRIGPRRGYWTFPSGFLERGESAEEGASREALEEARARVLIDDLFCVLDVPDISEVHLIFRGLLARSGLSVTAESSEVALLAEADVPWGTLAFNRIGEILRRYFEDRRSGRRLVHRIDPRKARESDSRRDCEAAVPAPS
jgi:flavin reductase (DIM6/NTAB) family NADH-FMN oxidoreductase RutF/ADP-ribose pyrophosphatase YjhB (NUDIX family)